jgi:hypothetical protein
MEQGTVNGVYTGFVQEIYPSDLGLNFARIAPARSFKSAGDGVGYVRMRSLMDNFSAIDERMLTRRPGAPAEKIDRSFTMRMFNVTRRHLDGISVQDQVTLMRALHPDAGDAAFDDVRFVRETMLLAKEIRFAGFLGDDRNYSTVTTSPGDWGDANYDVRPEIIAGKLATKRTGGLPANVMALSYDTALTLALNESIWKLNSQLKDRALDEETLARTLAAAFKFKRVEILSAQYSPTGMNEANEVQLADIYKDDIYFYYEPDGGPDFNKRCWALEAQDTFWYGGDMEVRTWIDNNREATINRVKEDSDFVAVDTRFAAKIKNVIK